MPIDPDDYFPLSEEELREVSQFAADDADTVLWIFECGHPDDGRPRAALSAARIFIGGAGRSKLQRSTAIDAHRAAKEAATDAARHAAHAAGDAAAAAYLHPFAKATQVGHILRASAHAACAVELDTGDHDAALRQLRASVARATPLLIDVLRRYPPAPAGRTPVATLMSWLDTALRAR